MARWILALALLLTATVSAQPQTRRATNVSALVAFPAYYHLRPVTIVGALERKDNGQLQLKGAPASVHVLYTGNVPEAPSEIRGEFWDLGRLHADDPRLASMDLRANFQVDPDNGWPRPGQVLALIANSVVPAAPVTSSIRSIVLNPARYLDQKITITGQFAGRNLLGDLPEAPGRSQFDFVLHSADAAIWVTNLRPRGRDFELNLDTRIDTGRWVEVTGVLQEGRGLQWINGEGSRVALTKAPSEAQDAQAAAVAVPAAPPPEVVFSAPAQDESDVLQTGSVRIQFSRDLDPLTLKDRVRVRYLDEEARILGEPDTPVAHFTVQYLATGRVLEVRFTEPLVRYRTIKVDLLQGILGTDKQPLAPWTLSFVTAGAL